MNSKEKFVSEIEKIKKHIKVNGVLRVTAIALNALGGILIGLYFRHIHTIQTDSGNNAIWYLLGAFLIGIYFFLNIWIFYSDSSDKIEFLDRIKHKEELSKQTELNNFLIQGLNEVTTQTCATFQCANPCDESTFVERLQKITTPLKIFIEKEYESKVAIGIHLNGFRKLVGEEISTENRIFKLHDDLSINSEIPEDLLSGELKDKKGFQRNLFTNLTNIIFDENILLQHHVNSDDLLKPKAIQKDYISIFSFIPDPCEEKSPNSDGGLYILTDSSVEKYGANETFFQLYGSFIGNYIDQYNQCINGRIGLASTTTT